MYFAPVALEEVAQQYPVLLANTSSEALEEDEKMSERLLQPWLKISEALANVNALLGHLGEEKQRQLAKVIFKCAGLFSDVPTCTGLIEHDVDVGEARPIKQQFYRVSPDKRKILDSLWSGMHAGTWDRWAYFF